MGLEVQRISKTQETFCKAFAKTGTIKKACQLAGLSRETVRLWEKNDIQGFREKYREAQNEHADWILELTWDRLENPKGNLGTDTLLIAANNTYNQWRDTTMIGVDDSVLAAIVGITNQQDKLRLEKESEAIEIETIEEISAELMPWEDTPSKA